MKSFGLLRDNFKTYSSKREPDSSKRESDNCDREPRFNQAYITANVVLLDLKTRDLSFNPPYENPVMLPNSETFQAS